MTLISQIFCVFIKKFSLPCLKKGRKRIWVIMDEASNFPYAKEEEKTGRKEILKMMMMK